VREFFAIRRARITHVQAGLPVYGGVRRVVGINRDGVAMPAGVSSGYRARPERGNLRGVSGSVLDALARALQLDQAEHRSFRFGQAAAASARAAAPRRPGRDVRPRVRRVLEGMTGTPAGLCNTRSIILAANDLCLALFGPP
jgi:hypothetical protein